MSTTKLRRLKYIAVVAIACCFLPYVTAFCDIRCNCHQVINGSHVSCQNTGPWHNSTTLPEDVFRLEIVGRRFEDDVISNVSFQALALLRHLAIERCGIKKLASQAFVRLEILKVLRLSDNSIGDVAVGSFAQLNGLKELFMDGNDLISLPNDLFQELDLNILDLSRNRFVQIPGNSFSNSAIRSLKLDFNFIEHVDNSSFVYIATTLVEVTISHNKCPLRLAEDSVSRLTLNRLKLVMSMINNTSFLLKSSIIEVDISDNLPQLHDFYWSTLRLPRTEIFHARNLSFNSIPTNSLTLMPNVKVLDFSNNLISSVRSATFRATPKLQVLNLARNNLVSIPPNFGQFLDNLVSLNLSGNKIRFLAEEAVAKMYHLKYLDLSKNRLQYLAEPVFNRASELIRIGENPFHCNCELLWLRTLLERNPHASDGAICATPFSASLASADAENFTCTPPSIKTLPDLLSVAEGSDIVLKCVVISDPLSTVSLEDEHGFSVSVVPSKMQDISMTTTEAVLRLKGVDRHKSGTYVCRASNQHGNASAFVTVTVGRSETTTGESYPLTVEHSSSFISSKKHLSENRTSLISESLLSEIETISEPIMRDLQKVTSKTRNVQSNDDFLTGITSVTIERLIQSSSDKNLNVSSNVYRNIPNLTTDTILLYSHTVVQQPGQPIYDSLSPLPTASRFQYLSGNGTVSTTEGKTDQFHTQEGTMKEGARQELKKNKSDPHSPVNPTGSSSAVVIVVICVLSFVFLVVLSNVVIIIWSKKLRKIRQYRVAPSSKRTENALDLHSHDNPTTSFPLNQSVVTWSQEDTQEFSKF